MKEKTARILTIVGHPLVLGTLYVIFLALVNLPSDRAWLLSFLVIGLVTIPIVIHNLRKLRKGTYSNFDVSDQNQRKGFYPFAILLFLILLGVIYFMDFPKTVLYNIANFFVMLLVMALFNFKIKASLHAAISFFTAMGLFSISSLMGILIMALAMGTTWSRLELKRHTRTELLIGALTGSFFGMISLSLS
jgi:hypothetical protein